MQTQLIDYSQNYRTGSAWNFGPKHRQIYFITTVTSQELQKNRDISPAREMNAVTDADMTIPKRRRAAHLELFRRMRNNNCCAQMSGYAMQIIPNAWHKLSVSFVLIS